MAVAYLGPMPPSLRDPGGANASASLAFCVYEPDFHAKNAYSFSVVVPSPPKYAEADDSEDWPGKRIPSPVIGPVLSDLRRQVHRGFLAERLLASLRDCGRLGARCRKAQPVSYGTNP